MIDCKSVILQHFKSGENVNFRFITPAALPFGSEIPKIFKALPIFVKDVWTIKDDLCKLYSYFMHDKHHYLDNYCSRESDTDGGECFFFLNCFPTLFYWNPKSFSKLVTSFILQIKDLVKTIQFAQWAEHRTLYVF